MSSVTNTDLSTKLDELEGLNTEKKFEPRGSSELGKDAFLKLLVIQSGSAESAVRSGIYRPAGTVLCAGADDKYEYDADQYISLRPGRKAGYCKQYRFIR